MDTRDIKDVTTYTLQTKGIIFLSELMEYQVLRSRYVSGDKGQRLEDCVSFEVKLQQHQIPHFDLQVRRDDKPHVSDVGNGEVLEATSIGCCISDLPVRCHR